MKWYVDRAKSATSDKRPEFLEMIEDSAKGMFDVLLVHKLDRSSRDRFDSARYKHKLKINGVRLVSALENLDGSPESIILESMLEGMAEYYSKNLAREVMKGLRENAHQCLHTGGVPPLGYDVDANKRLVINEDEAETVRIIYKMYHDGHGYKQIIAHLNSLGRKTKLGKPFGKNSIHDLLVNEKYRGTYVFNTKSSKDARGKRNNHAYKDKDVIRIPDGVPAIVDSAVFDAVQEKMRKNKRTPGSYKAKDVYLLSGLIFCGECANEDRMFAMAGNPHVGGRNKTRYVSYRCGNRDRTQTACSNTELRREYIENFVMSELERRIFNERNIPVLVKKLNEHLRKSEAGDLQELKKAQSDLSKVTKQIGNIVTAVSNGNAFQALLDQMGELEERKALLEVRAQELSAKNYEVVVTEDSLRGLFGMFRDAVKQKDIPEIKKFVDSYVQKVVVYRSRVEVTFRVSVPDAEVDEKPLELQSTETRKKLMDGSGSVA